MKTISIPYYTSTLDLHVDEANLKAVVTAKMHEYKAGKTEVVTAPGKDDGKEPSGRAKVVDLMALLKRSVQQSGHSKHPAREKERSPRRKSA